MVTPIGIEVIPSKLLLVFFSWRIKYLWNLKSVDSFLIKTRRASFSYSLCFFFFNLSTLVFWKFFFDNFRFYTCWILSRCGYIAKMSTLLWSGSKIGKNQRKHSGDAYWREKSIDSKFRGHYWWTRSTNTKYGWFH